MTMKKITFSKELKMVARKFGSAVGGERGHMDDESTSIYSLS